MSWATKVQKTMDTYKEAAGRLEDTIKLVQKAKDYTEEYDNGCRSYIDMHNAETALYSCLQLIEEASDYLARDMFGDDEK